MHRVCRQGIHHLRGGRGEGVPQSRTNWRAGRGARRTGDTGGRLSYLAASRRKGRVPVGGCVNPVLGGCAARFLPRC